MSRNREDWGVALVVIIVVGLVLFALGKWVLPLVAFVISYVAHAVAASWASGATAGATGAVSSQVVVTSAAVVAGAGAVAAVAAVADKIRTEPFQWLTPILSLLVGLVPEIVKAAYPDSAIGEIALQGAIMVLFFIGTMLLRQRAVRWPFKIVIAVVVFVLIPAAILLTQMKYPTGKLQEAVANMRFNEWLAIGLFTVFGCIAVGLVYVDSRKPKGQEAAEQGAAA